MKFFSLFRHTDTKEQPLELFDTPETISIKTFYKILESGNLTLLAKQPENLNESHVERLNEVWLDLLDFYYRNTNKQSWENFLRNFRNVVKIQSELISCKAALELCQLQDERGFEHLKNYGIRSTDLNAVRSAIGAKETKLELAEGKLRKNESKESFKFYKVLASVEYSLKRNIDIDNTSLEQWVAILADLSERSKAEQEALNKHKRK